MTSEPETCLSCSYNFSLADGSIWSLNATDKASAWLHEFAGIMGLESGLDNATHRIYFTGIKDLNSPDPPRMIREVHADPNGWQQFKNAGIYRLWRHEKLREVHMELKVEFLEHGEIKFINMWWALREVFQHVLAAGGTPMHAALAEIHGKGVLIAGPGDTGKSTCCHRLPDYWHGLCDDQVLVVLNKNSGYRVHPLPTWSDHFGKELIKSWKVERAVPLSAIFFLEQSDRDEAMALKKQDQAILMVFEAAKEVWKSVWERVEVTEKIEQSSALFHNAAKMAGVIPAYRLRVTLHGEFWKEMERVLF